MKFLPVLLASAALLAACGTASNPTSPNSAANVSNARAVEVRGAAANADISVKANPAPDDTNRVNPPIGKARVVLSPVGPGQPSLVEPPAFVVDRCTTGVGPYNQPGHGPAGNSVKHPPLPACAAQ